jgi:hypothetical protein
MRTVEVADGARSAWLEIERRGWGDGLPCVPPTPELVEDMLDGRDPAEPVAEIPLSGATATLGLAAVNAVIAGCEPAAFPIVLAAVRAAADPRFNLLAVQSTTNPAGEVLVVNGPVASAAGIESGAGCMGAGARANLTVGRAVRLVMTNVGGARPGAGDRATHGFPGKVAFCFAEAEEASPWPTLHVALGMPPGSSAVTVVSGSGSLNLLDTSDDAEELLLAFSRAIAYPSSNDYLWPGTPLLVMSPEHADVIARGGFDRAGAQRFLHERAAMPAAHVTRSNRASFLEPARGAAYGGISDDTAIHPADRPEDILIAVAGGPGTHSVYVPTFGDSRAVTEEVHA